MKIKLLAGNKTLNSAVWYTISSIMAKGITVLLTPFFTRILSVSEYGEYTNFISWQNILVVIFSMELSATILRARFDYKDNNIFSGYVFTVSTFGVVFSITVTLLIFACSGFDMENVISIKNHYIWLLIDIIVFAPLLQIFQAEQRSEVKYKVSSVITLVYGICSFLIPYIFTFFLDDKLFALLLGIAANATLWGAGIYFFYFIKPHGAVKTEYIKYALIIAIPVIPHMISNIIMGNSDKLMINSICGAEYAALYGVVYTCALVVNLIRNAINNAWIPWFYKNLDEGNVVKVKNVSKNYLYLFTAASVFLCLTGPEMVMVLGGVKYYTAAKLVPMIMLGVFLCPSGDLLIDRSALA
ncbi:MAG: oligosaccharide flippase family protein, partial [Lachnospiraceae bacterium]|nr:oligosaccharide flippase family protein [Lachnospiraceae bacterium]